MNTLSDLHRQCDKNAHTSGPDGLNTGVNRPVSFGRKLSKPKGLHTLASPIIFLAMVLLASNGWSQNNAPQTVTLLNGVQYEGKIINIDEIRALALNAPIEGNRKIVLVDDGLRRVFLSNAYVNAELGASAQATEIEFDIYQRTFKGQNGFGTFIRASPFNEHGHRLFTATFPQTSGVVTRTYAQGITKINPRYCEVETLVGPNAKRWTMSVATGTVPKQVLRNLLLNQIKDPKNPDEFFDIALFFQQAKNFDQAGEELRQIEVRFPHEQERVRTARERNAQLKAQQILREVKLRIDSGQSDLALQLASVTNKEQVAPNILAQFQDIEETEATIQERIATVRFQIKSLIDTIGNANVNEDQIAAIKTFEGELKKDLNRFNVDRLDAYLRLINDKSLPDQQKLALAISGWLLGSNNAIENLAIVQSMFTVRDLVREYLQSDTTQLRRSQILNRLGSFEAGSPAYVANLIRQMKPVDQPEEVANYTGESPIEFYVEIPGTPANPETQQIKCLAHLPPQYNPYRKYPMILSLPSGRQTVEQNLAVWCGTYNPKLQVRQGHASRNGYIVVSVQWKTPGQIRWKYSAREHKIVLDALYHSLRKFSIDDDRVFLSGHGIGGDGAYDVGISHPEHWAGVLGFSGKIRKYTEKYYDNDYFPLPIYCVQGQKDLDTSLAMKFAVNKWIQKKKFVNPTVVHYIGRLNELLIEDIPESFKWMRGQRRLWPDKTGFQFVCHSLRPWDNYFWFFELDGIPRDRIVSPALFNKTENFNKFEISGKTSGNNRFSLGPPLGSDRIDSTLWLSPEFVDFAEQIRITGRGKFKGFVKPSTKTLLEDVYRRADRTHPYWARIDNKDGRWIVDESLSGDTTPIKQTR